MLKHTKTDTRLINNKETLVRVYTNAQTGGEVTTYHLYTDASGQKWFTFEDLFALPFIRQMAGKKVVELYGHDLALEDIKSYLTQFKQLLKSSGPEKYEQCYAKVLEMETLATAMADPVKQCIGLCTVYLLLEDEAPDTYNQGVQNVKLSSLTLDLAAQSFFLDWWTEHMRRSGKLLNALSRIVSSTSP